MAKISERAISRVARTLRAAMTDLEMTKLCAQAIGVKTFSGSAPRGGGDWPYFIPRPGAGAYVYDPLDDDAQAMALVKKFHIHIDTLSDGMWSVDVGWLKPGDEVEDFDLNRAICECVAKVQAGK